MAEQWYYQAFGQDFGPLSLDELARMLHEGELSDDDLVRQGTRGAWSAAAGSKILTERATALAIETAEVATDIDSFMLMDEKPESKPEIESFGGDRIESPAPAVEVRGVWYFQSLGQEFGPVPFSELLEMAGRGEVGPDDSVRKGETGQWVPAGLIDGLFPDATGQEDDDVFAVSADVLPTVNASSTSTGSRPGQSPSASWAAASGAPVAQQPVGGQQYTSGHAAVDQGWYFYLNDQEIGPVGITDLQGYASTGQISPEVYVKYGASGDWVLASQVPQLYAPAPVMVQQPVAPAYQPVAPAYQPVAPAVAPVAAAAAVLAPAPSAGTLADAERMELAHQLLALLKREILPGDFGASAAPPSAGGWYCNISGSVMGPVTIDALVQMVLQKRIFADDMIRLGTQGEWFPAKTVPELFPSEAAFGKKKGAADDGESVLSKIDKMYRDAQEAKERMAAENKAKGITEDAEKPAARSEPVKPAGDVFRNLNSNIARAATMSAEERKKMQSSSSSSSGDGTMAEQLDDLLAKVGLRGKGLYVLIGLVVIGAGVYFSPTLLSGMAASSAYDSMLAIQTQIMQVHDSGEIDPATWQAQSKDVKKRIKELMAKVKGGTGASPLRDISKMGLYLQEMAENAAVKPPPGTPPEEDPYMIALNRFKDTQKKAKTKLGKKK